LLLLLWLLLLMLAFYRNIVHAVIVLDLYAKRPPGTQTRNL
jgi:hypothetical protein